MFSKMVTSLTIALMLVAVLVIVGTLYSSDSEWSADQKCKGSVTRTYDPKPCSDHSESECDGATVTIKRTSTKTCKGTYSGYECRDKTVNGETTTVTCKWKGSGCGNGSSSNSGTLDSCSERSSN